MGSPFGTTPVAPIAASATWPRECASRRRCLPAALRRASQPWQCAKFETQSRRSLQKYVAQLKQQIKEVHTEKTDGELDKTGKEKAGETNGDLDKEMEQLRAHIGVLEGMAEGELLLAFKKTRLRQLQKERPSWSTHPPAVTRR